MDGEFKTLVRVAIFDKFPFFFGFLQSSVYLTTMTTDRLMVAKQIPLYQRSKYLTKLLLHGFGLNVFEKYFPFNCDRN